MKFRHNFIIMILGLIVLIPLRTYQLFYAIDPKTGFYITSNASVNIFTAALVLFILALMATGLFSKGKELYIGDIKGSLMGVVSIITALFIILASLFDIMEADFLPWLRVLFSEPSAVNAQAAERFANGMLYRGIAGILSGLFYLVFAGTCFVKQRVKVPLVLVLCPVAWTCIRLTYSFMGYTSIAEISEYLFDVMMMVFSTLFLYYCAKYIAGLERLKTIRRIFAFGSCAVIFCFLCTLPRYIRSYFGKSESVSLGYPNFFNMVLAFFIIAFMLHILINKREDGPFEKIEYTSYEDLPQYHPPIVINDFKSKSDHEDLPKAPEQIEDFNNDNFYE